MEIRYNSEQVDKVQKYKKAANKAWRKIREDRRKSAALGSKQLTEFVPPGKVTSVSHPELPREIGPNSFGRGIVSLFHKTPANIACGPFWELRWAFGCIRMQSMSSIQGVMSVKIKIWHSRTHFKQDKYPKAGAAAWLARQRLCIESGHP